MIFMVKNTERIAYDPEYDRWFSGHPCAPDYIFAPIRWIMQKTHPERGEGP